jgi:hypothetical protein
MYPSDLNDVRWAKLQPLLLEPRGARHAAGRPALISDKVNIWREIEADNAGLVAAGTLDGTVSLLRRWLAMSWEQRCQMGEQAMACFAARFEIRRATENLLAVIRDHVEGCNAGSPTSKPLSQASDRA